MQGAITLMWVIYNLYLVDLLTRFGFPQIMATGLLIFENLLAMVMEPLMGTFSDRLQHQVGTKFPFISLGVVLAAGCFLAIPMMLFNGQGTLLRWLLPLMMVAWALAMTVFRSPALSLLGRYAFRTQLPQAASILTLVGGLTGAARPLAHSYILAWGPMVAFGVGSAVLLLATFLLSRFQPNEAVRPQASAEIDAPEPVGVSLTNLGLIFGAGVGVALGFRLIMTTYPTVLQQNVTSIAPSLVMGLIFISLALTAIPAGQLATRLGNRRTMLLGLTILVCLCAIMISVSSASVSLGIAVLLGGAYSLVLNGTLPFALTLVPTEKAGLGTGLYFSGGALATSLFASLLRGDSLPPHVKALLAALGFLLAGLCIASANSSRASHS